ncbi:MAG: c-type cytochrome [Polyangiaceae bacterium]|nr:c-type cytochrome [Polyangiaceae bacterium]
MKTLALILVATSLVWAVGCGKDGGGGGDSIDPATQAEAAKIYMQRCSTCHGPNGAGDGPGAAALNPKPRNLQEAAWQSSVDDAYIEKIIKLGGPGVGKSAAMPPNPDLASNEPVVKALRAKVRALKR